MRTLYRSTIFVSFLAIIAVSAMVISSDSSEAETLSPSDGPVNINGYTVTNTGEGDIEYDSDNNTISLGAGQKVSMTNGDETFEYEAGTGGAVIGFFDTSIMLNSGTLILTQSNSIHVGEQYNTILCSAGEITLSTNSVLLNQGDAVEFSGDGWSTVYVSETDGTKLSYTSNLSASLDTGSVNFGFGSINSGSVSITVNGQIVEHANSSNITVSSEPSVVSLAPNQTVVLNGEYTAYEAVEYWYDGTNWYLYGGTLSLNVTSSDECTVIIDEESFVTSPNVSLVYSEGSISLDRGWITLPEGTTVNGFTATIDETVIELVDSYTLNSGGVYVPSNSAISVNNVFFTNSYSEAVIVAFENEVSLVILSAGQKFTTPPYDTYEFEAASDNTQISFDSDENYTLLSGSVYLDFEETISVGNIQITNDNTDPITVTNSDTNTVTLNSGQSITFDKNSFTATSDSVLSFATYNDITLVSGSVRIDSGSISFEGVMLSATGTTVTISDSSVITLESGDSVSLKNAETDTTLNIDSAVDSLEFSFDSSLNITLIKGTIKIYNNAGIASEYLTSVTVRNVSFTSEESSSEICANDDGVMLISGAVTSETAYRISKDDHTFDLAANGIIGISSEGASITSSGNSTITYNGISVVYYNYNSSEYSLSVNSVTNDVSLTDGTVTVAADTVLGEYTANTEATFSMGGIQLTRNPSLISGSVSIPSGSSIYLFSSVLFRNTSSDALDISHEANLSLTEGQSFVIRDTTSQSNSKTFTSTHDCSLLFDSGLNIILSNGTITLNAGESAVVNGITFTANETSVITYSSNEITLVSGNVGVNVACSFRIGSLGSIQVPADSKVSISGSSVTFELKGTVKLTLGSTEYTYASVGDYSGLNSPKITTSDGINFSVSSGTVEFQHGGIKYTFENGLSDPVDVAFEDDVLQLKLLEIGGGSRTVSVDKPARIHYYHDDGQDFTVQISANVSARIYSLFELYFESSGNCEAIVTDNVGKKSVTYSSVGDSDFSIMVSLNENNMLNGQFVTSGTVAIAGDTTFHNFETVGSAALTYSNTDEKYYLVDGTIKLNPSTNIYVNGVEVSNRSDTDTISVSADGTLTLGANTGVMLINDSENSYQANKYVQIKFDASDISTFTLISGTYTLQPSESIILGKSTITNTSNAAFELSSDGSITFANGNTVKLGSNIETLEFSVTSETDIEFQFLNSSGYVTIDNVRFDIESDFEDDLSFTYIDRVLKLDASNFPADTDTDYYLNLVVSGFTSNIDINFDNAGAKISNIYSVVSGTSLTISKGDITSETSGNMSIKYQGAGSPITYSFASPAGFKLLYGFADSEMTLKSGTISVGPDYSVNWGNYNIQNTGGNITINADNGTITLVAGGKVMLTSAGGEFEGTATSAVSAEIVTLYGDLAKYYERYNDVSELLEANPQGIADIQSYQGRLRSLEYDVCLTYEANKAKIDAIYEEYNSLGRNDNESRFETYKRDCIADLNAMHSVGESQEVSTLIDKNISGIRGTYYNIKLTYAENESALDKYLSASIKSKVDELNEASFVKYQETMVKEIESLHIGETCVSEKALIDDTLKYVRDFRYNSDNSFAENRAELTSKINQCNEALKVYRNDEISFDIYKMLKLDYLVTQETFETEDVKDLVKEYVDVINVLKYSSRLSLEDNLARVDEIILTFDIEINKVRAGSFSSFKSQVLSEIANIRSTYENPEIKSLADQATFEVKSYNFDTNVTYGVNTARITDIFDSLELEVQNVIESLSTKFSNYCHKYISLFNQKRTDSKYDDQKYQDLYDKATKAMESLEYDASKNLYQNQLAADQIAFGLSEDIYEVSSEAVKAEFEDYKNEAVEYISNKVISGSTNKIDVLIEDYIKKVRDTEYDSSLTVEELGQVVADIVNEFDTKLLALVETADYDRVVDAGVEYLNDRYGNDDALKDALSSRIEDLRAMEYDPSLSMEANQELVQEAVNQYSKELFDLRQNSVKDLFENYRQYVIWQVEISLPANANAELISLVAIYIAELNSVEFDNTSYLWNKKVLDDIVNEYFKTATPEIISLYRETIVNELNSLADGSKAVNDAINDAIKSINTYRAVNDLDVDLPKYDELKDSALISIAYAKSQANSSAFDTYVKERRTIIDDYLVPDGYCAELRNTTLKFIDDTLLSSVSLEEKARLIQNADVAFFGECAFRMHQIELAESIEMEQILEDSAEIVALINSYVTKVNELSYADYNNMYLAISAADSLHDEFQTLLKERRLLENSTVFGDLNPDGTSLITGEEAEYPDDSDEIWGIVSNASGMTGVTAISISKIGSVEGLFDKRQMASETSSIALLASGDILGGFDISLYNGTKKINSFNGEYVVRILLPEDMRGYDSMQVAYVDEFGDVQVYEAEIVGNYLVFTTTHFSEFYVLGIGIENGDVYDTYVIVIAVALIAVILLLLVRVNIYYDGNGKKSVAISLGAPEGTISVPFENNGNKIIGWNRVSSDEVIPADIDLSQFGKYRVLKLTAVWEDTMGGSKV